MAQVLEENSELELKHARQICLVRHLAKSCIRDVGVDTSKTNIVEDIERVDAEDKLHILSDAKIP